ncbi:MAG TPA: DUF882 domain-containing protein [Alphaproteobacteria bacterium]|nr:DUF882 domain-containing protein [Alphaproteobacteria bacterium]HCS23331.1 Twin-arginine translocation pathway signal [Rhodospirillaceae bacterium]HRI76097.1 DUF882 domain-containing protein [Alphaproteobacteria bacterium]HRJ66413.1 DUF882 domain-containing protein [Alphaproteobacteria bacterium]
MQDLIERNALAADEYDSDRRGFLKAGLFAAAALGFWTPALAEAAAPRTARIVYLQNPYTGEKFTGEYWYNGRYIPSAFLEIKKLMRDHRVNEQFPIDPRLMDILYVMNNRLGTKNSYHVLSGYRSPATNARLRRQSEGVARNSLHMTGQAVDIRLPGTRLSNLRKTAMDLKSGGVGFYPRSDFVHVDTGRVRHW